VRVDVLKIRLCGRRVQDVRRAGLLQVFVWSRTERIRIVSDAATTIDAWENDPSAASLEAQPTMNDPVAHALPDLDPPGFKVGVAGKQPPADTYHVGTAEFRYWALADALARGAGFWSKRVPAGTAWQQGNGTRLIAVADEGVDLNAYYDRNGLHFFHDSVRGTTVYSGESPDVVCHELGHAVLDAIKPQLWDASAIETAAFHESFGDISAILSALQLESVRQSVIEETGGQVSTASRLSRLAESLGWAIRQLIPDSGDAGCLRSAVHSFYYQAPASLPPRSPASSLSSEPHNFSRIFTGGFYRMLGGIFARQPQHDAAALLRASEIAGTLLVEGVRRAPVVPAFYAQVAAQMVAADTAIFAGTYRRAIASGFVGTGVLSVTSAAALDAETRARALSETTDSDGGPELPRVPLVGAAYGLPGPLLVNAAIQPRRLGAASGLPDSGDIQAPSAEKAADSFVVDLIRRGRIAAADDVVGEAPIAPGSYTTHEIRPADGALELRRTRFDCGFGAF
jgi:hypothetical protein